MLMCDLKVSSEINKYEKKSVGNDLKNHQHLENVSTLFLISLKLRGKTMNNLRFFVFFCFTDKYFSPRASTEHINNSCFDKRIKLMPFGRKNQQQQQQQNKSFSAGDENEGGWKERNQKFIIFLTFFQRFICKNIQRHDGMICKMSVNQPFHYQESTLIYL